MALLFLYQLPSYQCQYHKDHTSLELSHDRSQQPELCQAAQSSLDVLEVATARALCLVYGIVAYSPTSSYLSPSGLVPGGRPAVQGAPVSGPILTRPAVPGLAVPGPAVYGPSPSYSSQVKGAARRPSVVVPAVPVVAAPTVQRPAVTGVPHSLGSKRLSSYRPSVSGTVISASTVQRPIVIGVPSSMRGVRPAVSRPVVPGIAVTATPIPQKLFYAGVTARKIPTVEMGAVRPISSGYGSRTVGYKAPY
ncbi:uncharacterized protein Dvir_GJ24435 [Drosophila virilis]|uniref:Uncharacterized protein n=1 Tax=Drosophila virilis TaxID=7244 RepID=B4LY39_DROVI|nr:uncharacterized protein Dvir_GJ24435 [Drosophila virilis]